MGVLSVEKDDGEKAKCITECTTKFSATTDVFLTYQPSRIYMFCVSRLEICDQQWQVATGSANLIQYIQHSFPGNDKI